MLSINKKERLDKGGRATKRAKDEGQNPNQQIIEGLFGAVGVFISSESVNTRSPESRIQRSKGVDPPF